MPIKNISQNDAINQSNSLIDSLIRIKKKQPKKLMQAKKLFALALAEIDIYKSKKSRTVQLNNENVFNVLKLQGEHKHFLLNEIALNMQKETVYEFIDVEDFIHIYSLIEKISFSKSKKNMFTYITFTTISYPLISEIKEIYPPDFLLNALDLTSKYSIILFQWISVNYYHYEKLLKSSVTDTFKPQYISLDDLRVLNGISSDKLNDYSNFYKLVVVRPCQEINEKTNFNVTYRTEKDSSVMGITFLIEKKSF